MNVFVAKRNTPYAAQHSLHQFHFIMKQLSHYYIDWQID